MTHQNLRVLFIHNFYRQRAGEDESFVAERDQLRASGVAVQEYVRSNQEIPESRGVSTVALAWRTTRASDSVRDLRDVIVEERPDIAHFHNTFPLVSPAAYTPFRDAGIPVVQTLRNFRLFCANGVFFRDGHICEDCVGKSIRWPGVVHACYRSSRLHTLPVAAMETLHGWLGTWSRDVDIYVVPSRFMRDKLIDCGLEARKIRIKPDVVADPGRDDDDRQPYLLYVGRLVTEKGIGCLLRAHRLVSDIQLKVVGAAEDGATPPTSGEGVEYLGPLPHADVMHLMKRARLVVVPSESYETFGRTVVEAYACGTPVLASRVGALEEIVDDGVTGFLFSAGDSADMAGKIEQAWDAPEKLMIMGSKARQRYDSYHSSSAGTSRLRAIYREVLQPRG